MSINWRRLVWVIFIFLYSGLFFYNFLHRDQPWILPYIFTMVIVVWLGVEYYQKHLFLQSGSIPIELYSVPLRFLLALFFYSSFIIGLATSVGWISGKISAVPVIPILGLLLLVVSLYIRFRSAGAAAVNEDRISRFYLSIVLLMISLALGYGSLFLLAFSLGGILLALLNYRYERLVIRDFNNFIEKKPKGNRSEETLWRQYLEQRSRK